MSTETTDTRVRMEVDSPSTSATVGLYRGDKNYSGVAVNTVEHVRLYASGSVSESDAIGQASGQVWAQSLRNIVGIGQKQVLLGSGVATLGAAKKGITILAGLSSVGASSESSPATKPATVSGYESKAAIAQGLWIGFEAALGIAAAAMKIRQTTLLHSFSWVGASTAVSNVLGASLNIVGLTGKTDIDLPGVHLFSEGGTFIASNFGSVNIAGLGGTLMSGLFVHQFALWGSTFRGWARVSLGACGPVDMASLLWFECKSDGAQTVSARAGTMKLQGQEMKLGSTKIKGPQLPTMTIAVTALNEVKLLSAKDISAVATVNVDTSANNTEVSAVKEAAVAVGGWKISVKTTAIAIGAGSATPAIKIDNSGVTFSSAGNTNYARMANGEVLLKSSGGSLSAKSGTITVDGLELKIG